MKISVNNYLNLTFTCFVLLTLFVCTSGISFAASQGKIGKSSSASVNISVTVNQTFNTLSPNELLLNPSNNFGTKSSKPFCIAHHGFHQNAAIPYELKVDNLLSTNSSDAFAYKVFLEDENALNNKLHLEAGTAVPKQSKLKINQDLQKICAESGQSLSIEMNEKDSNNYTHQPSPGLLILMVAPI